jgi:hypothetical protein
MSDPRERLVAKLKGMASVSALVGSRIWPMRAPQGQSKPYIAYRVVDRVPINHAAGTTASNYMRIQLDLCSPTYDGAIALASAVRGDEDEETPTGLSGWIDGDGRLWHLEMEQEDADDEMPGRDEPEAFRVMQDYIV